MYLNTWLHIDVWGLLTDVGSLDRSELSWAKFGFSNRRRSNPVSRVFDRTRPNEYFIEPGLTSILSNPASRVFDRKMTTWMQRRAYDAATLRFG